ncbi:hypothetical protein COU16_01395 [Candidatus Kaiserbacteria bacterium CG10_big_fil_rev_8_21_14_0_10_47_16]|uniref:Glycosyl transferase family 1 domain-containing protein n=1 Tax=Candidatus Kaiserbacteria bacterium CG10_big_fil_rev_8_21_14_0_10_47_16 TaxID=1974608 RepID=A0A2H0UFU5_9BACT|nr:MAG: hypothetical protein COU16_01395 [Candidatus Kaiserbacteria bacterium CG10_big_fil_rev_8_21_14_0_10_47_16]
MRIVLATPIYPPAVGGPAEYAATLPKQLVGLHEVVVVAYTNEPSSTDDRLIAVRTDRLLPIRLVQFFFALWGVSKEADVLYAQNAVAAGLPAVLVGILRSKRVVIKFVGDEAWERAAGSGRTTKRLPEFLQNPDGGIRTTIFMAIQKFVLRHADVVTTPSAYLGECIVHAYRLPRDHVVTNYNAAAPHTPLIIPLRKKHQLATAVRLVNWKGVDGIIQAVALLTKDYPDISLMIAGDGPERARLETLVSSLEIRPQVTFLGSIPQKDAEQLFAESSITVLNSTYEGLPFGVLMSFAVGTPVIATNIPGTDEVVHDGKTGLLIPTENPAELARAIAGLFEDETLRTTLTSGGTALLNADFSWEAHIKKLRHLLYGI